MTGRRGRSHKQLLDDIKKRKEKILEIERGALDRILWRTRFGRGYGPVVRQTAE
jgi:hypothetical protein